jgi:hypothetical protein
MMVAGEMGEEVTPIGKPFISGGWEFFFTFNGTPDSILYHYVYDKENSKSGLRYNPDVNFWFRLPSTERQEISQHMRRYTFYLSDVLSMIDKGTE